MSESKQTGPEPSPPPNVTWPLLFSAMCVVTFGSLHRTETPQRTSPSAFSVPMAASGTDVSNPAAPPVESATDAVDATTGLRKAPGWELVASNCSGCHSTRLVVQNRGNRDHWLSMIRWMQRTQNLWMLAPDVENTILTYLSTHYGEQPQTRRAALPASLMPPYPQAASAQAP